MDMLKFQLGGKLQSHAHFLKDTVIPTAEILEGTDTKVVTVRADLLEAFAGDMQQAGDILVEDARPPVKGRKRP